MENRIEKYTTKGGKDQYRVIFELGIVKGIRKQYKPQGFLRRKEADAFRKKFLKEYDENAPLENSKKTFGELFREWLEDDYKTQVKERTYKNTKYIIDKHILNDSNPFLDIPVNEIERRDVQDFINLKNEEGLRQRTMTICIQKIRKGFEKGIDQDLIKKDPSEKVSVPKDKEMDQENKMKIWTREEIDRVMEAAREEKYYILFALALGTGARQSELLGLRWQDIDLDKQRIKLSYQFSRGHNGEQELSLLKTANAARGLSISKELLEDLKEHKQKQDAWKEKIREMYNDRDYVIASEFGAALDHRNVLRVMDRIIQKAGVRKIRFHDMRHTHISYLIDAGVDMVKIASRVGHADVTTTLSQYGHLIPGQDDKIGDVFENSIQK